MNCNYRSWNHDDKIDILFVYQSATVWASLDDLYAYFLLNDSVNVTLALYDEVSVEKGHINGAEEFLMNSGYDYTRFDDLDFNAYHPHIAILQLPYDTSCRNPNALSLRLKSLGIRIVYIPYGNETADTEEVRRVQYENFVVENAWRVYTGTDESLGEYNKYCRNRESVKCVGIPKYDSIIREDKFYLNEEIKNRKGQRKLLTWKIHFPKRDATKDGPQLVTPQLQEYISFLDYIEKRKDIFFVILAHPKLINMDVSSLVYRDGRQMDSIPKFFDKAKQLENVYIDTASDYRNTLYNSDAVIMDRSGLIVEIAIRNIPTLYLLNEDYREKYLDYVEDILSTYVSGCSCSDMMKFVDGINGDDKNSNARRDSVKKSIPYLDGKCCERIFSDITAGLKEDNISMKKKVVLYGCGSVCSHYLSSQYLNSEKEYEIIAVADTDKERWGSSFLGYTVINPEMIKDTKYDVIVVTSEMFYYDIKKYLVYDLFLDERRIKRLDEFTMLISNDEGNRHGII